MQRIKSISKISSLQWGVLVILRIAIGWHFLYEGIAKLLTPGWSSAPYLDLSRWIFSGFFHWIASNQLALQIVNILNIWGLILIGFGLLIGCFTRIASIAGMFLLLFYYAAHPPLTGLDFGIPAEGKYLIVDKNLVELFALSVIAFFPTGHIMGLDKLIMRKRNKKERALEKGRREEKIQTEVLSSLRMNRREILKSLATLPFLGAFVLALLKKQGWESYEEKQLEEYVEATTSATIKVFDFSKLKDLKGELPCAKIGDLNLSRVILGGNLVGGWAHARDLIYASKLVKAYHNKTKVFETLLLAEKCGINTFLTNPVLCRVINEYWKRKIGKIQFISDCAYRNDIMTGIKMSIDHGAHACYVQGGIADKLVEDGKVGEIGKALDFIKANGLPGGIGAHALKTVEECVKIGLEPDFWMKTIHHNNYWSARPDDLHDNNWCLDPEGTIEIMKSLEQPWIAFKVLAAGSIQPKEGFKYAFENGADFICAGMYDFQIVDDVNIAMDVLSENFERVRPWRT